VVCPLEFGSVTLPILKLMLNPFPVKDCKSDNICALPPAPSKPSNFVSKQFIFALLVIEVSSLMS
jgi:hypothetical protein